MAVPAVAELTGGRVVAPDLLGDGDRRELRGRQRTNGRVHERDLELAFEACDLEALPGRHLAVSFRQERSALVVDSVVGIPVAARDSHRPSPGDDFVHQLLGYGDVRLSGDRRIVAFELLQVLLSRLGRLGRPGTSVPRDLHEPF